MQWFLQAICKFDWDLGEMISWHLTLRTEGWQEKVDSKNKELNCNLRICESILKWDGLTGSDFLSGLISHTLVYFAPLELFLSFLVQLINNVINVYFMM